MPKLAKAPRHFWQCLVCRNYSKLKFCGNSGNAGHNFIRMDIPRDRGFCICNYIVSNSNFIGYTYLSSKDNIAAKYCCASNPHLGGQDAVGANFHPVTHLHEVVDFCASANPGFAHGWSIHTGVGSDFHLIFQHHDAYLWDFSEPLLAANKAKSFATNHGIGMHNTAPAKAGAPVQNRTGMNHAVLAEFNTRVKNSSGMNPAAFTHRAVGTHNSEGADEDMGANGSRWVNPC